MSIKLTVDGVQVEVQSGSTLLDAATAANITIPTMCYERELGHITSCMICVVEDLETGNLIPACSAPARAGMNVQTLSERVISHRKAALELLLSEHTGDCEGPCRRACPAYMDIPEMIRLISAGNLRKAIEVVKEDIALPGVLGRICPAPCEKICRRKDVDEPVSICMLKRYVADEDFKNDSPYIPSCAPDTGSKVAVVGGGPAGMSAAYFIRRVGHDVVLFEKEDHLGGTLNDDWARKFNLEDVIKAEADVIRAMGVDIRIGTQADAANLRSEYDAVVLAAGRGEENVEVDRHSFASADEGVFAAGSVVRPLKLAVMATAHARSAAVSVTQYLRGEELTGRIRDFDFKMPQAVSGQAASVLMKDVSDAPRQLTEAETPITSDWARAESRRCMECDCMKKEACRLRRYSNQYYASQSTYPAVNSIVERDASHAEVVYEPGKCIKCGICVKLSEKESRSGGLAFVGRGIETRVAAPFEQQISDAIKTVGLECAKKCPTGAISMRTQ